MKTTNLLDIQKLAKEDREKAEKELLTTTRLIFPNLDIKKIKINQQSYSLNSVFGYITIGNKEYFFKFHSEEGEEKTLTEYYKSYLLAKKSLPVLLPLYKSTKPGKQFLIYKKIKDPNVFDVLDIFDRTYLKTKKYDKKLEKKILFFEEKFDKEIIKKSLPTLKIASSSLVEKEELNQLFYRRLVSNTFTPRLDLFYKNKNIKLSKNQIISFEKLKKLKWEINGVLYKQTLETLIENAKKMLNPKRLKTYPVLTGHGDDHNGNKFFTKNGFVYYDAAFAGKNQYALLTFVKTTFHDTLAHPLWLYNPEDFNVAISYEFKKNIIKVNTNYDWEKWAPIREKLLWIKIKKLWVHLLKDLQIKNLLEKDWEDFLRSAFFSCPFLVYNLIDQKKLSFKNSLFALTQCIEVGSKNGKMDKYFEYIKQSLN